MNIRAIIFLAVCGLSLSCSKGLRPTDTDRELANEQARREEQRKIVAEKRAAAEKKATSLSPMNAVIAGQIRGDILFLGGGLRSCNGQTCYDYDYNMLHEQDPAIVQPGEDIYTHKFGSFHRNTLGSQLAKECLGAQAKAIAAIPVSQENPPVMFVRIVENIYDHPFNKVQMPASELKRVERVAQDSYGPKNEIQSRNSIAIDIELHGELTPQRGCRIISTEDIVKMGGSSLTQDQGESTLE